MRRLATLALALAVLVVTACGGGDDDDAEPPRAVVRVFASTSLTDAFQVLGVRFTEQHEGVRVDFTFADPSALVDLVAGGEAASVLATSDPETMQAAVDGGHARGPAVFARNHLALIVADGNPKGIADFGDLARPDVTFGVCAPSLPCGALGAAVLEREGVARPAAATGVAARAVLNQVADGTIDAGIVFATTPRPDDDVDAVVELDDSDELIAVYEISVLAGAVALEESRLWMAFVLGAEGQRLLAEHGFAPPA